MVRELKRIDISSSPELLRIAEEVKTSRQPRMLGRGSEDMALVVPVGGVSRGPRVTKARDYEAVLAVAGSWEGLIDAESFKQQIRAARGSDRPVPSL